MEHIAILGNGISGITAARHIRKLDSNVRITVISSESQHFYSRTALMYIFMGHMKYEHTKPYEDWFWEKNRIDLKYGYVTQIDFNSRKLHFDKGDVIEYDKLILATGSKSNRFGWPGQDLKGVQSLYSLQDLELLEENSKDVDHAIIVGGGLIGVEMSEMLHTRGIKTTFLIRETGFWQNVLPQEEADLIGRHLEEHNVRLLLETSLKEIIPDGNGRVRSVMTDKNEKIECQLVGLTVGVSPNIELIKNTELDTDKGILVNEYLETNIDQVYAVGDCVQLKNPLPGRRSIEPVWYTGRMMGETVAKTATGRRTAYQPGVWFNSAKFYDIEYQTYGNVPNEPEKGTEHFYWENINGDKSIRLVFDSNNKQLLGMNSFGMRWRHEIFDQWIARGENIQNVLAKLNKANFDPEFFKNYNQEITAEFNRKYPALEVIYKNRNSKWLKIFK